MITLDTLATGLVAVAPKLTDTEVAAWLDALQPAMAAAEIDDTNEVAAFLGQTGVETGGYTVFEENLHYTAARLCAVWPSRFPSLAAAAPYAMNPQKLGNRVYANRLGNGDEASGDGFRFRGQGLVQLTGRANVAAFAASIGKSPDAAAVILATKAGMAQAACWFWRRAKLNPLAEAWQIRSITQAVNGGLTGYAQRVAASEDARDAMEG